jgi:hypothetical protein
MKAWTSLTDTSVVKTYREVPALRNNAFREFVVVVATTAMPLDQQRGAAC